MNVAVRIQSHPKREAMALALAEATGGIAVFDPEPMGARSSPWRTYRRCLETLPGFASGFMAAGSVSHVCVLQDDVSLARGFLHAFHAALAARPDRVIAFFISGQPQEHSRRVLEACARDEPWAELDYMRWLSAVATCWPVRCIHPMLRFVDSQKWPESFTADDEIIGRYLRAAGEVPLATVPSLVQHPDMVPSLIGRRDRQGADPGRVAACFADNAGCDVTQIDWTRGPD